MRGRTHVTTGMAASLLITNPSTVPGVIAALAGGAIGGWIVDLDVKTTDIDRETVLDSVITGLVFVAFFSLDYFVGNGTCEFFLSHLGPTSIIWGVALVILMIAGFLTPHRTFMHSFLAAGLFTAVVFNTVRPLTIPFLIGYLMHMGLDMFNRQGLQLFFPIKWRPCFMVWQSKKKSANDLFFWPGLFITFVMGSSCFVRALTRSEGKSNCITMLNTKAFWIFNRLEMYLVIINIISFIVCFLHLTLGDPSEDRDVLRSMDEYDEAVEERYNELTVTYEFLVWLHNIIVFAGGGLGLLAWLLILRQPVVGRNGNLWAFCYTSILYWVTIYLFVCNPFNAKVSLIPFNPALHRPILLYILAINIITALAFLIFRNRRGQERRHHTLLLFLGAIGGTIGGIATTLITGKSGRFAYAVIGFFMMLMSQIVFVGYLMMIGVV